jgi:integrase
MLNQTNASELFSQYYARWIKVYKEGAIRKVTMRKYRMAQIHTHASLLLFAGVSIASVARRLGHASMTTTQKTYLHIIHELENQDVELVMRSLSGLS